MPLATALLRLHDGDLKIRSEPDIGTTVSIVLPAEAYRPGTRETGGADAESADS